MTTEDGIGVPVRRREDRRFLTGRGRYVHDIVRPGQLHAVFLRSPHAHAEILALDKTEASKELTRIRRQWFAKRKSVLAILKEVMTSEAKGTMTRLPRSPTVRR